MYNLAMAFDQWATCKWTILFPDTRPDLKFALTEANKSGYGQLHVQTATKRCETQSNRGRVVE
jgi:hypothetical protein